MFEINDFLEAAKINDLDSMIEIHASLSDKIDVNMQDVSGNSPLHYAMHNKNFNMINFLIKNKGDMSLKNKAGYPASSGILH